MRLMFNLTVNSFLALLLAVSLTAMPEEPETFYSYRTQEPKTSLDSSVLSITSPVFAPERISEKIVRHALFYGADPALALNVACAESCSRNEAGQVVFNPQAKNPSSTASGVYQFIAGTWQSLCEGEVFNEDDNIRCGARILAEEGGIRHWEASRQEGFGGGWENEPYEQFQPVN